MVWALSGLPPGIWHSVTSSGVAVGGSGVSVAVGGSVTVGNNVAVGNRVAVGIGCGVAVAAMVAVEGIITVGDGAGELVGAMTGVLVTTGGAVVGGGNPGRVTVGGAAAGKVAVGKLFIITGVGEMILAVTARVGVAALRMMGGTVGISDGVGVTVGGVVGGGLARLVAVGAAD